MSENTAVDTVSGLDYEEIEEAVMETARGRWFLTEFARRQRGSDTKLLLDAIRRLEDQLLDMPATTGVSSSVGHLVEEAEDELKRLSGSSDAPSTDGSLNARDLAARLATITSNLRDAVSAPADSIAEKIRPEIDKLDACASQHDEFASKLSRAAQMVRRLRSSDVITDEGLAAKPEMQLAAPDKQPEPEKPVSAEKAPPQQPKVQAIQPKPAPIKAAPAFVPSDDDIFESNDKPLSTTGSATTCAGTAPKPTRSSEVKPVPAPAKGPDISSDTLNFADIDVPPLPNQLSEEDEADVAPEAPATKPTEAATPQADDDLPPEPNLVADKKQQGTADRIIQVTRSYSRPVPAQPAAPTASASEPMSGRINMANPMAANQTTVSASAKPIANPPATSSNPASANSSAEAGNGQKKRIIVIRRPADGTEGIPLAGDGSNADPDAPGAA
ncbi:MAG: hypothetical protein R3287_11860 [Anderseniella sp.]|nr:hypothetical protein [Anderseniella sp.]